MPIRIFPVLACVFFVLYSIWVVGFKVLFFDELFNLTKMLFIACIITLWKGFAIG